MGKFKDSRILNGGNSRVKKSDRTRTCMFTVLNMVADQKTGRVLTNRKSEFKDPEGRLIPRKLKPMHELMQDPAERFMYVEFCKEAGL